MKHLVAVALPLALTLALGACSGSKPTEVDENLAPQDPSEELISLVRKQVPDPTGIRDAAIAGPELRLVDGKTQRQVVCLRFNPRDERGQYIGEIRRVGIFFAGNLVSFTPDEDNICQGANYRPFPELTKLCRELICPDERGGRRR